jgi:hypothetical protein
MERRLVDSWPSPDHLFSKYNLTDLESSWNIYNGTFDHGLGKGPFNSTDWVAINASIAHIYMYALYWSISTATTVG